MASAEERQPLLGSGDQNNVKYSEVKKDEEKTKDETKKEEKEEKAAASFKELFRYATCWDVFLMFIGSLFSIGHGAGWPLLSIVFGDMTNDMVTKAPNTDGFTCGGNGSYNASEGPIFPILPTNYTPNVTIDFEEQMTQYALYYVYIASGVLVSSYLQVACWMTACERQTDKIRKAFFRSILRQEIAWFDKHQSGELTTRLADDLERVREGLGDKFSLAIQFFAAFLVGFAVGFWKGWKMTLVMMSLTPILAAAGAFMSKRIQGFTKREQESYAKAGGVAEEVLSCIRTVISFNGQKQEIKRYAKALEESKKMGIKKAYVSGIGMGVTLFIMFSTYALAFWYGNTQVEEWYTSNCVGGMSPGEVLTVFFCVMIGSFSIGNATPHLSSIASAKGGAAVIYEIIDMKPEIDASSKEGRKLPDCKGSIDFVGVNFNYPSRPDIEVLKNLTISIKPGQTVALVGASGCGKSTTVNLLQRFYDPSFGHVYLDGHSVKELNIGWLRQNIGVVSQEPILFDCSIEENILLGCPSATKEEIIEASKAANAHSFISKLPKGYETLVGEHGAQLSGGQKQRVAIARALIRDPKILLLDEATSALDSESEKIVQDALDKACAGRTTIMIAHRLSTIYNADVIFVLDEGQLVEQGKHSELMEKKGTYHALVTMQEIIEEHDEDEEEDERDEVAVLPISESETTDVEERGKPRRKRTTSSSSGGKIQRQTSVQISRQVSVSGRKNDEKEEEEEKVDRPGFFRMMKENKSEWPFIVMGTIAAALNGCTMPVFAVFFSEMIKVFMERGENGVLWSLMFLALGFANFLCHSVQGSAFGQAGERLTMRLRLKVFTNLIRQDVTYFDDTKHSTGALTTRLATDASMVKNATGIRLAILVQSFVGLIAALVIAFIFGWKLALVVLGCVPVLVIAGAVQMKAIKGSQVQDQEQLEEAGKIASEAIENIRTVQSLTREEHFYNRYSRHLVKPYRMNLRNAQLYGMSFGFSQAVVFYLYAAAFRFGAYLVAQGEMEPDKVYRVFFAIAFTGISLGQASSFLPDYTKAQHAAGVIFKILDTVPKIDIYSEKGALLEKVTGTIVLKGVNFRYPTRPDVAVLKKMTLSVEPGQTIALVGPSGCGKSTIVSLLQRFYDTVDGEVLVDNINVRDLHLAKLRSFLSVVSQEPILFDCSIRDNIGYGVKDATMEDVIEASRMANIHDFIASLPAGYDTVTGEKGTQISGGQKQRIAIARALIRNPRILLLDEATSALDTESEKVVQSALENAQVGRTCVVIAHRLSTIQNADCIFVIDNGEIVEKGTHNQLLLKKGVYATLVNKQQLTK